jgi:chemotaxis signal transduction protein
MMATYLQFRLQSGPCAVPLSRVYRVAAFAELTGQPDEYFMGWLRCHDRVVPVFDLNRVVCEVSTPEELGSRIILVEAPPGAGVACAGLLAPAVTGTTDSQSSGATLMDLDLYLQMLANFIPPVPDRA